MNDVNLSPSICNKYTTPNGNNNNIETTRNGNDKNDNPIKPRKFNLSFSRSNNNNNHNDKTKTKNADQTTVQNDNKETPLKDTNGTIARLRKLQKTPKQERPNANENEDHIIRSYKYHTTKMLTNERQGAYLEERKSTQKTPPGLIPTLKSNCIMSKPLQQQWTHILEEAGRKLRNTMIEHHKEQTTYHEQMMDNLARKIDRETLKMVDEQIEIEFLSKRRRSNDNIPSKNE